MEINPVAAASAFLGKVKLNFSSYKNEPPTVKDNLVADKLLDVFHEFLTDFCFEEQDELLQLDGKIYLMN